MADLTITAANVEKYDTAVTDQGIAGATITAGQAVYKDSFDSDKLKLADCDVGSGGSHAAVGIALHAALSGQPLTYAAGGDIDIGATLTVGEIYVLSGTAGGVAPVADLATSDKTVVIGVGLATDKIHLLMYNSGVTHG